MNTELRKKAKNDFEFAVFRKNLENGRHTEISDL